jgi:hypothetical protein
MLAPKVSLQLSASPLRSPRPRLQNPQHPEHLTLTLTPSLHLPFSRPNLPSPRPQHPKHITHLTLPSRFPHLTLFLAVPLTP